MALESGRVQRAFTKWDSVEICYRGLLALDSTKRGKSLGFRGVPFRAKSGTQSHCLF